MVLHWSSKVIISWNTLRVVSTGLYDNSSTRQLVCLRKPSMINWDTEAPAGTACVQTFINYFAGF